MLLLLLWIRAMELLLVLVLVLVLLLMLVLMRWLPPMVKSWFVVAVAVFGFELGLRLLMSKMCKTNCPRDGRRVTFPAFAMHSLQGVCGGINMIYICTNLDS